jgi:hypothetical protein
VHVVGFNTAENSHRVLSDHRDRYIFEGKFLNMWKIEKCGTSLKEHPYQYQSQQRTLSSTDDLRIEDVTRVCVCRSVPVAERDER